jgi:hypothetical protein
MDQVAELEAGAQAAQADDDSGTALRIFLQAASRVSLREGCSRGDVTIAEVIDELVGEREMVAARIRRRERPR